MKRIATTDFRDHLRDRFIDAQTTSSARLTPPHASLRPPTPPCALRAPRAPPANDACRRAHRSKRSGFVAIATG